MPGRVAMRRVAVWQGWRMSALLPSTSVLIFFILLWVAFQLAPRLVSWQGYSLQSVLAWGLPNVAAENADEQHHFVNMALLGLTGIDPQYLPGILERGLPVAMAAGETAEVSSAPAFGTGVEHPLNAASTSNQPADLSQQPAFVAIYHTHNAETYIPYQGQAKVEGQNGGVSLAGNEMAHVLEQAGIRTVHDLTIHDYPDFPTSYIKSAPTASRLAQQNPKLQALLDVHRDAGLPVKETVRVGNEDSARIMIVVGNDNRLPYPHWQWQENYAFAQKVAHRLQEQYPGVLKQVMLKDGRYNQNVLTHAILVEVGSDKNTLNEALVAARCFATVLAEVIRE